MPRMLPRAVGSDGRCPRPGHGVVTRAPGWRVPGVLLLALSLAGCGYHLRGPGRLPAAMLRTRIAAPNPYGTLATGLREALQSAGATMVGNGAAGRDVAVLHILQDAVDQRVVAVNQAGKAIEYELRLRVSFSVHAGGRTVLPRQDLQLTRDYPFDPAQALGNQAEAEDAVDAMRREMVDLIMLRLNAAATKGGGGPRGSQ